jgi:hypothetical protein
MFYQRLILVIACTAACSWALGGVVILMLL